MSTSIDTAIVTRIIYLLNLPYTTWPAYKYGIIDKDGKIIKEAKTPAEKDAWTPLHKLVHKLRTLIAMVPGGKTQAATLLLSLAAISESLDLEETESNMLFSAVNEMTGVGAVAGIGSQATQDDPDIAIRPDNEYKRRNQRQDLKLGRRILGSPNGADLKNTVKTSLLDNIKKATTND